MSRRKWAVIIAVWLLSLVTVGAVAQMRAVMPLAEPLILTGGDIAFRVEGTQGITPVGKMIVRFNGKWVEPKLVPGPVTLAAR